MITTQAKLAQKASFKLITLNTTQKNEALNKIAKALLSNKKTILKANEKDLRAIEKKGKTHLLDRVKLNADRLQDIVNKIYNVINLADPIGEGLLERTLSNGLKISYVRVPLGVVAIIYEARPNVTIDAISLGLKSSNAVILKGGSDALCTNRALIKIVLETLAKTKVPQEAIQFIDSTSHKAINELLSLTNEIDVVIPRGGQALIKKIKEISQVPVIETGASVVHTYVDNEADLIKAAKIVFNAKTQRPSVCNALDTVLVHKKMAKKFLPLMAKSLKRKNVELRVDKKSYSLIKNYPLLKKARPQDFKTEFLDLILAVKIVKNLDEALGHIKKYSLKHSEAIVTENYSRAERFLREVDAACVYVNASTRFSDGGAFGLGAEIGISTQKLHVRGPFALEGLTSFKWLIRGEGQIRK